jgi:hypothetical protein
VVLAQILDEHLPHANFEIEPHYYSAAGHLNRQIGNSDNSRRGGIREFTR